MKTFKLIFAFLAVALIFTNCKKDYDEPTINFVGISEYFDVVLDNGEENISFEVKIEAEAGIDKFEIVRYSMIATNVEQTLTINTNKDEWDGKTSYTYNFNQTITLADFEGGISSLEYEFKVRDTEGVQKVKVFHVYYIPPKFDVTFTVQDGLGNEIADAIITLNGVTNEAGEYEFTNLLAGTYAYTVEKEGYLDAEGEIEITNEDVEKNVILHKELSEYSEDIVIGNTHQNANANYNGQPAVRENTTIGIKYRNTDAGIIRIEKTEATVEWSIIDSDENITYYEDVIEAYNNGDLVTEEYVVLNVDDLHKNKAYQKMYFVSKVGDNYYLIHYKAGQRHPEHGNVVVFEYKTKAD